MREYGTIPQEFRHALETAFPNLVSNSAAIKAFEPDEPFQPDAPSEPDDSTDELIPVDTSSGEPRTDARALHARLGSKRDFSNWFKQRVEECDFVENQDFGINRKFVKNPQGGRPTIDYWLTLDAAKHMAMLERNEVGRRIRQYLIDAEKKWRAQQLPVIKLPRTYVEALRALADSAEEAQQLRLENLEARQVIGETKALLSDTQVKLETAEDQLNLMIHKIELPKVSILTSDFCKLYLEAEGRQGLALVKTATAEKVHAVASAMKRPWMTSATRPRW